MKKKDDHQVELIREIHHRVKNNLQIIASILRLQIRQEESPAAQAALSGAVHRILGMVQVHDLLAGTGGGEVDLRELLERLLDLNLQAFLLPGQVIRHGTRGPKSPVPAEQAQAVAVAANELIINSLKHAFAGRKEGRIDIEIAADPGELRIVIADDGIGLPTGFTLAGSSSLGLRLVKSVVEADLQGSVEMTSERGTRAVIHFPQAR